MRQGGGDRGKPYAEANHYATRTLRGVREELEKASRFADGFVCENWESNHLQLMCQEKGALDSEEYGVR